MKNTRTHYCGELTVKEVGQAVTVTGWVHSWRDHGGVKFIDVRDYTGLIQIVFRQEVNAAAHAEADHFRTEYVLAATGTVMNRSKETVNPKLPTGMIEIEITDVELLNKSETPPIEITEEKENIAEENRLRYRYLDLRRPNMNRNLRIKHMFFQAVRNFLNDERFFEIETPILNKSTPEGARDFLVPSRLNPEKFYALPQSPQLFKQILMIAGMDRYYQFARCFRDEDQRKNRQFEFTQLDMELSFINQDGVLDITERMIAHTMQKVFNITVNLPFPRLSYHDAIHRYCSDKPDIRFGLEVQDVSDIVKKGDFKVFSSVIESGGIVWAINAVGAGEIMSRKDIDDMIVFAQTQGAKGLAWTRMRNGELESVVAKKLSPAIQKELIAALAIKEGDIVFFSADTEKVVIQTLGAVRQRLGEILKCIPENTYSFLWVVDFPLFKYNEEDKRWNSLHHPFTMPRIENTDMETAFSNVGALMSDAYDIVLNGEEIGGGSVRIHRNDIQQKVFEVLGLSQTEIEEKFGFLIEALQYGAPPHAGIAFGVDRWLSLLLNEPSIRDVIAFPKTQRGICMMSDMPSEVTQEQLRELSIKTTPDE